MPALHQIVLGVSPLTDQVYLGTVSKQDPHMWLQKRECMSDFCSALLAWVPEGKTREFRDDRGTRYEVVVRRYPNPQA